MNANCFENNVKIIDKYYYRHLKNEKIVKNPLYDTDVYPLCGRKVLQGKEHIDLPARDVHQILLHPHGWQPFPYDWKGEKI